MKDKYYDENLLRDWAAGASTRIPAPLSVRSRWYRKAIGDLLERFSARNSPHVLSIGAGTGLSELELQRRGFQVTASDVSEEALKHCDKAGLATLRLDLTSSDIPRGRFDVIYVDGVLGHLTEDAEWADIWQRLHASEATCILLSNDLSDTDGRANHTVHGEPGATFFRPTAGFFARSASATNLWRQGWCGVLRYRRPGRGIRRRELSILNPTIDEQRGGTRSH